MKNISKRYLWIFIIIFSLLPSNNSSYSTDSLPLGKVEKDSINIRTDSTINSPIIGKLTKNEYVEIMGEKYEWYKIRVPDRFRCYVYSKYLNKIDKDRGEVRIPSLNVRSNPSLDAPIIGRVKKGDILNITKNGEGWVEVSCYPYARGWVYKLFVKLLPDEPKGGNITIKESGKEKEEKQKPAKKNEVQDTKPYIAKGKLRHLKKKMEGCEANYILENDTGFLLLRIDSKKINTENLFGEEIKIWGEIKSEECVYVNVERIAE